MAKKKEYERRFLVKYLPEYDECPKIFIQQGYLSDEERVRFRMTISSDNRRQFFRSTKDGTGRIRDEDETEISRQEFYRSWEKVVWQLTKKRYLVPCGNQTAELNFYQGDLRGYVQVEVEFKTEKEMDGFHIPDWFGQEVTDDIRHTNYYLARYGVPKEAA